MIPCRPVSLPYPTHGAVFASIGCDIPPGIELARGTEGFFGARYGKEIEGTLERQLDRVDYDHANEW